MPHLCIIILLLPNIIDHILGWRWEDVIQKQLIVVAILRRCLGTSCAIGFLATIKDIYKHWVISLALHL
jgi:hypothetical protein